MPLPKLTLFFWSAVAVFAQAALKFRVATVKLAAPNAVQTNRIIRISPTRMSIPSATLNQLFYTAYGEGMNMSTAVTGGPAFALVLDSATTHFRRRPVVAATVADSSRPRRPRPHRPNRPIHDAVGVPVRSPAPPRPHCSRRHLTTVTIHSNSEAAGTETGARAGAVQDVRIRER